MERQTNLEFRKEMKEKVGQMEAGFQRIHRNQEDAVVDQRKLILELGTNIQRFLDDRLGGPSMLEFARVKDGPAPTGTILSIESPTPVGPLSPGNPSPKVRNEYEDEVSETGIDEDEASQSGSRYIRKEILGLLKPFADRFGQNIKRVTDITSRASQVMVHTEIKSHITAWIRSATHRRLWIQGPHDVSSPSQNTLTAVCLVALSSQKDIPCISYFCDMRLGESPENAIFYRRQELIDMLRSLIVQMVLIMPEVVDTLLDFSPARFETLEQEAFSIDDVIQLLYDLRSVGPPYLHCIISGIEVLEDRDDIQHTQDLLRVLDAFTTIHEEKTAIAPDEVSEIGADKPRENLSQTTKLCFTTDGYMDALARLAGDDRVDKVEYSSEVDESFGEETSGVMPHWSNRMN